MGNGFDAADARDPMGRFFIELTASIKRHVEQGHGIDFVDVVDELEGSVDVEIRCSVCVGELPIARCSEAFADELQAAMEREGLLFDEGVLPGVTR